MQSIETIRTASIQASILTMKTCDDSYHICGDDVDVDAECRCPWALLKNFDEKIRVENGSQNEAVDLIVDDCSLHKNNQDWDECDVVVVVRH